MHPNRIPPAACLFCQQQIEVLHCPQCCCHVIRCRNRCHLFSLLPDAICYATWCKGIRRLSRRFHKSCPFFIFFPLPTLSARQDWQCFPFFCAKDKHSRNHWALLSHVKTTNVTDLWICWFLVCRWITAASTSRESLPTINQCKPPSLGEFVTCQWSYHLTGKHQKCTGVSLSTKKTVE